MSESQAAAGPTPHLTGGPAPVLAVDLTGAWRAHPATPELAREFTAFDLDDRTWAEVSVPCHWRTAGLDGCDGPVLHRRRFEAPPPGLGTRAFLELDGVFHDGDVWLDGTYLGATQGYFVPHAFEVTEQLTDRVEHVAAVEVASAPVGAGALAAGVFADPHLLDPGWNPGGLWRPVRVRSTGAVRIARCRITCIEAGTERGRLLVDLTLDARGIDGDRAARVDVTVDGPGGERLAEHVDGVTLADGDNHRRVEVRVDSPPLWWPWRLGDQPLPTVRVEVHHRGHVSDACARRTALREVRVDDWRVRVNGEPMFLAGAALLPTRQALADASPEEIAGDVALAVRANLDLLRVRAHVARPELYDAADEAGVLLWQDVPLRGPAPPAARRIATRQAPALVDLLGHHPSVLLWCAHDSPTGRRSVDAADLAGLAAATLPSWNKDVLDRSVARALRHADRSRPVLVHSGVLPGLTSSGSDTPLSLGWRGGDASELATWLRRWPRLGRFVSLGGPQALPAAAPFLDEGRWPHFDWERIAEHHGFDAAAFAAHVPPAAYPTLAAWRAASQAYQAAVVQLQVEDLRRRRGRPTGGFLYEHLADARPAISDALVDHERIPKPAYAALRDSCRPVLPVLDPRDGAVHVVNETADALSGAVVTVTVVTAATERTRRFSGAVAPRDVTFVGHVDASGATRATVTLEHPAVGTIAHHCPPAVFALFGP